MQNIHFVVLDRRTMQDEMKVVRGVLDERVYFAGFDNEDVPSVERCWKITHDDGTAPLGDEVNLVQLAMIVPFVDASIREADEWQCRMDEFTIPSFSGCGCIVPGKDHWIDSS